MNLFNVFIIAFDFAAFILLKNGIDGFTTTGVIHSPGEGYALTHQTVLLFIARYWYDLTDATCFHGVLERIRTVLCSVFLLAAAPELRSEEEAGVPASAEFLWQHLVKVQAK